MRGFPRPEPAQKPQLPEIPSVPPFQDDRRIAHSSAQGLEHYGLVLPSVGFLALLALVFLEILFDA